VTALVSFAPVRMIGGAAVMRTSSLDRGDCASAK
jgi:hypothetical protein